MAQEITAYAFRTVRAAWRVALVLILIVLAFLLGVYTAVERNWLMPVATAQVSNQQSLHVKQLRLMFKSHSQSGVIDSGALEPGATRKVVFPLRGEGSYELEATLEDGRVVRGGYGYVESGYHIEHEITSQDIQPLFGMKRNGA